MNQLQIQVDSDQFNLRDYIKDLKTDFFSDHIFVLTPNGDVINLIKGATVLDFAFAIHTDLGLQAKAGKINGIYRGLKTPLSEQDIVEIVLDKKIKPQKSWLNWAKTPLAKQKIRAYLRKQTS